MPKCFSRSSKLKAKQLPAENHRMYLPEVSTCFSFIAHIPCKQPNRTSLPNHQQTASAAASKTTSSCCFRSICADALEPVSAATGASTIESTSQSPSPSAQSLRHHYNAMYRFPSLSGTITSHPATSRHVTSMLKLLRSGTIGWTLLKSSVWQLGRLLQNGSMPPLYVCCDMYVRPWGEAVFVALRSVTEAAVDGKHFKSASSSVSPMIVEFEKSLRHAEQNSIGLSWCTVCLTINPNPSQTLRH
jgi:hypothetical protein